MTTPSRPKLSSKTVERLKIFKQRQASKSEAVHRAVLNGGLKMPEVQIVVTINPNGGLRVDTSAPMSPLNILAYLEVAKACTLKTLMEPQPEQQIIAAPAQALGILDQFKVPAQG